MSSDEGDFIANDNAVKLGEIMIISGEKNDKSFFYTPCKEYVLFISVNWCLSLA